jgi:hypothetical protein
MQHHGAEQCRGKPPTISNVLSGSRKRWTTAKTCLVSEQSVFNLFLQFKRRSRGHTEIGLMSCGTSQPSRGEIISRCCQGAGRGTASGKRRHGEDVPIARRALRKMRALTPYVSCYGSLTWRGWALVAENARFLARGTKTGLVLVLSLRISSPAIRGSRFG